MSEETESKQPEYHAEDDDGKTFDMYHTRSHWTVVFGIAFIVAFLLFVLFILFFGGEPSV